MHKFAIFYFLLEEALLSFAILRYLTILLPKFWKKGSDINSPVVAEIRSEFHK